jgi:hypothetical protein
MDEKMRITGSSTRPASRNHGVVVLTIPTLFCLVTAACFIINVLLLEYTLIHDDRSTQFSYIRRTMPLDNPPDAKNTTIERHNNKRPPSVEVLEGTSEELIKDRMTTATQTRVDTLLQTDTDSPVYEVLNAAPRMIEKTCVRKMETCQENWWVKRELHREWTRTGPRLVSIRGERHSGTKLASQLIQNNAYSLLPVSNNANELYGWKHGFFPLERVHPADILLVISRDVFSWALAMFKEPYNMMFEEGMTEFGSFLRGQYRAQHCQMTFTSVPKQCTFPMEHADNIIQVRKALRILIVVFHGFLFLLELNFLLSKVTDCQVQELDEFRANKICSHEDGGPCS